MKSYSSGAINVRATRLGQAELLALIQELQREVEILREENAKRIQEIQAWLDSTR